jgi:uncharacterized protein RhaS with RHS repeats
MPVDRRRAPGHHAYDAAGDRTGITWPDAAPNALTATYAYDILQRVETIKVNGTTIAAYGYDPLGRGIWGHNIYLKFHFSSGLHPLGETD